MTGIPYSYDQSTALVVVDVQNDFADPAGSLYVPGGEEVPAVINPEILAAVDAGSLVVYTQDWHPPSTPHFQKDGGVWPVHCLAESWGADLHPALLIGGPRLFKGTAGEDGYSGFTVEDPRTGERAGTGLEDLLRGSHVTTVVVAGLATDYCVKATALDSVAKGFSTVVLTDAIRAVDLEPGDGDRATKEMGESGVRFEPSSSGNRREPPAPSR